MKEPSPKFVLILIIMLVLITGLIGTIIKDHYLNIGGKAIRTNKFLQKEETIVKPIIERVKNLNKDSDNDGDPDSTDCAPLNPNKLSPRDNLIIDRNIELCPGKYYLTDQGMRGIFIFDRVNFVSLNCNNAEIIGDQKGIGVMMDYTSNSVIENCNIRGFYRNLGGKNSFFNSIINNEFSYSISDIFLVGFSHNFISNNKIHDSQYHGIHFHANTDLSPPYNFVVFNTITNNEFYNIKNFALHLNDTRNNVISNNFIHDNYGGIESTASDNNQILNNSITNNNIGIKLAAPNIPPNANNEISYNYICHNIQDLLCVGNNIGNHGFNYGMEIVVPCSDSWPVEGNDFDLC
ncbi:MAG: right-handed parallel beta-helix repeat-containing protein [Nanoarchaeota archaeon]|nr:right-handed parallel beta-helix repeat-containing protein [Nanoarchaeota archaeon]MBU1030938.1 right-handed parallel beta-helix repeat-containing protein [Nanoarchaeota archaeon]